MTEPKIQIGFTRSDYYMSKLIMNITGEPVSHCVIIVEGMWVVHSNFYGVHIEHIYNFQKHSEIIYSVPIKDYDIELFYAKLEELRGRGYDLGGMIFLGLATLLRHYCPKYVPKQNLWQQTGLFMCTEFITKIVNEKEDSLITPYKLYQKLITQ